MTEEIPPFDPSWDVDEADKELEEFIAEHETTLGDARKLLKIAGKKSKKITWTDGVDEVSFRVKIAIPFETRQRFTNIQKELVKMLEDRRAKAKALGVVNPELIGLQELSAGKPLYEIIASLCLDDPWDKWQTWAMIDKEMGLGPLALGEIFEKIKGTEAEVKSFR